MQKITPFLWFDDKAEEATNFYISVFKNSKILSISRYGKGAISFMVNCATQKEVDELWYVLSEGGKEGQCGWLKDKFGVSWQIVPAVLGKLMSDPDPIKSQRVMKAMLKMNKIDIKVLKQAYDRE